MWYAVKLHFKAATFRCRMELDHGECRVEDIKRFARTAWPSLVDRDIKLMYHDDEESLCPLIEESWSDAVELGVEANPSKEWNNRMKLYVKLREEWDDETIPSELADIAHDATGSEGQRQVTVLLCDCDDVKKLISDSTTLKLTLKAKEGAKEDGGK